MGKTRGVHETTPELRNRMVGMYEAGLGLRDIAAAVNCSQRTVKRWLNRFDKEGTVETRERCGRKRATTTEEDDAIIRLATQTPITAAKAVLPALGLTCSVDTIRERLHKAGIHNWSPSRKHMQRIPFGDGEDAAAMQQAVWRPTGTQLGKKKIPTKDGATSNKSKKGTSSAKRKPRSLKIRARDVYVGDGAPGVGSKNSAQSTEFGIFSRENVPQSTSPPLNQGNDDLEIPSDQLPNGPTHFGNALSLVSPSEPPIYQHHPGLRVIQSWPLDLVQVPHEYPQEQPQHQMSHDEPPEGRQLQELHGHRDHEHHQVQVHAMREEIQPHHHNLEVHQQHPMDQELHQQPPTVAQTEGNGASNDENNGEIPAKITRSESCSNSCGSNDRSLSDDDEFSNDGSKEDPTTGLPLDGALGSNGGRNKKKGGKAKGTLETSVEIRNRMIGMSEAGLSTLSIALAINRSERTVKRWLERWNKEGNVQTKERKGRRRITTKEQDDAIIAMATQHPLTAAKHVAPALGLNCSVDTIRERLHKAGIHSWKLGKKLGEGNAVHTVHLWQPSGNRPNKPKISSENRKKSSGMKKRVSILNAGTKRPVRKKNIVTEVPESKIVSPVATIINEPGPIQFHESVPLTNYVSGAEMMQPVHDLSATSLIQPQIPQSMQAMGPMMQQRPDCRMATTVVSPNPANPGYPSCMINTANNHPSHMDQPDPLNYEPYIWSF